MPDDGHAPTIPNIEPPRHVATGDGAPVAPDARYSMVSLLGRGGMGEVWLAHDARVDRDVAIKLMRGDRAHAPDEVARFLREARVQGRLEHPAIVPVHDIGGDDAPYFAMKRLVGTTLADVLADYASGDDDARARWPRRVLLARLVDVCFAIELAHRRGVVHRDLKPANIMLGDFGETYVLDWGLARILGGPDLPTSDLPSSGEVAAHTIAGAMLGTPGYMSPEQVRGESIDGRTDVYALGCVLYEIVAGEPAVPRDNAIEATLEGRELRPSRAAHATEVPPELDELTLRATASEPATRLASARELGDAIQRYLDGDRDLERRRVLADELAARATRAFAQDRDSARAEATRDAGRALALDPTNAAAAALLARILLEPPKEMPAPARRSIERERASAARALVSVAAWVYLSFIALVPMSKLLGATVTWPLALIAGELAVLAALSFVMARCRLLGPVWFALVLVLHAVLLVTVGLTTSSLVVLPILVFGMLPAAQLVPTVRRPVAVCILMGLAFVIPLALEALRLVPPTFSFSGADLVIHSGIAGLSSQSLVAAVVAIAVGQIIGVTALLFSQRCEQERAQEQLHVHKWHLEQLVSQ